MKPSHDQDEILGIINIFQHYFPIVYLRHLVQVRTTKTIEELDMSNLTKFCIIAKVRNPKADFNNSICKKRYIEWSVNEAYLSILLHPKPSFPLNHQNLSKIMRLPQPLLRSTLLKTISFPSLHLF